MKVAVKLYYYNANQDKTLLFGSDSVVPIIRTINIRHNLIKEAIEVLIKGILTEEERSQGYSTEFPHPEFRLIRYGLSNGILTLTFKEVPGFTSGGSSRVLLLRTQIEKTARQFKEVKRVIVEPDSLVQP